jgi:hypothetical protein
LRILSPRSTFVFNGWSVPKVRISYGPRLGRVDTVKYVFDIWTWMQRLQPGGVVKGGSRRLKVTGTYDKATETIHVTDIQASS